MIRCIALLSLFLIVPRAAFASGEVFLSWDDCADAGQRDMLTGCLSNDGVIPLVTAFSVDQQVTGVIGVEVVVDLQVPVETLPDWWRMLGADQCRDGSLTVNGNFTGYSACVDPWHDLGEGVPLYYTGPPRTASQARIVGTYAIRSDSARVLEPGVRYYALTILISNARSVFPGECAGCMTPACLVLNTVRLLRGTQGDVTVDTPGPGAANRATWRGDGAADCVAVPVRAVTWGQVKSLYR